jgi:hypothetical protein
MRAKTSIVMWLFYHQQRPANVSGLDRQPNAPDPTSAGSSEYPSPF